MSLKVAVIGAGHLGKIHARLLSGIDDVTVVGITDPIEGARQAAHDALGVATYASHHEIIPLIDAAIVAAPSDLHTTVATDLLTAGKHVLVEKPLTTKASEAKRLVELARRNNCVLQVGHVERFNPAWNAAADVCRNAKFVEAVRASSFPGRCLDVGVVMDLMIHDLELVLSLTSAEVVDVQATGLSVVSDHEDLAETRLTFACGLVANLKASRVSLGAARSMQVFGPNGFAEIDFGKPAATLIRPSTTVVDRELQLSSLGNDPKSYREQIFAKHLVPEHLELQPTNAILDELHDFVTSIRSAAEPTVSGRDGARAVEAAEMILFAIKQRVWNGALDFSSRGPHVAMPSTKRKVA